MYSVKLKLGSGSDLALVVSGDSEPRPKMKWVNGQQTGEQVLHEGKPVYAFDAMAQLNGDTDLGMIRVESTLESLPKVPFGQVLRGQGTGEITISARDEYNVRVSALVDSVVVDRPNLKQG